jgi:hypothetical protein
VRFWLFLVAGLLRHPPPTPSVGEQADGTDAEEGKGGGFGDGGSGAVQLATVRIIGIEREPVETALICITWQTIVSCKDRNPGSPAADAPPESPTDTESPESPGGIAPATPHTRHMINRRQAAIWHPREETNEAWARLIRLDTLWRKSPSKPLCGSVGFGDFWRIGTVATFSDPATFSLLGSEGPWGTSVRSNTPMDITFGNLVVVADKINTVPEPSALVLLGIGAFGLSAYAWRRRRAA